MKRCPICHQTYPDQMLRFCRVDGSILENIESAPTEILPPRPDHSSGFGTSSDAAAAMGPTIGFETDALAQTSRSQTARNLRPETRYAKSGDTSIAYQVVGDGPLDLVYVPGWVTHLEYGWEEPAVANFYRRLARFSRLILFDKRGTGMSDQSSSPPTLEQRMDDVRAVMQAVDSERAVVFGMSEGGNMALLFAATYPERTVALITFGVFAKRVYDPDYPWAPTPEQRQKFYDAIQNEWGGPVGVEDLAPSMAHDERFRQWWATYQRRSASPRAALAFARTNTSIDVRHVLPAIRVPTLVMHRINDLDCHIEEARYIAAQIPGAKLVELEGQDHLIYVGEQDTMMREVERFVSHASGRLDEDSVLATVLYVTNQRADQRFSAMARREAEWFKGRVSEASEQALCATFDGPIRAIKCAEAIRKAGLELGMQTRAGLHTGLCEMRGSQAGGETVEISKQVAGRAATNAVWLTNTVRDLISGTEIVFTERDAANGAGLPANCRLFAAG